MTIVYTRSGNAIDLTNPCSDAIDFAYDVAPALGNLARFSGHAGRYSVAEHSFLASHIVAPEHAMHAVLHDAHEAYLGDISTPAREAIGLASVQAIEAGLQRAVLSSLGLAPVIPAEVHDADEMLLHLEGAQLFDEAPAWVNYDLADECAERLSEAGVGVCRYSAQEASRHFYMRLMSLEAKRQKGAEDGHSKHDVA